MESISNNKISLNGIVELRLLEKGTAAAQSEGDRKLGIAVDFDGWSGSYDSVWIARLDWTTFIADLNTLERDRRGEAVLRAMSPGEFELHLEIINPAGHLAVHGFLAATHWTRRLKTLHSRIEFWLELDPSLLHNLRNEFVDLAVA